MKVLLWALVIIASHGAALQTWSSAAGDRKDILADTARQGWKMKEDVYMAQRLDERLHDRIDAVQSDVIADSLNLGKPGRRWYKERLAKKKEDSEMLSLLLAARYELQQISANKMNCLFTFQFTYDEVGGTCRDPDNVITIHYNSEMNAIHELAHAWQIYKGIITGICGVMNDTTLCENELVAYKRQYAFDATSFDKTDPSYSHTVQKISDIDCNWMLGLRDRKDNFVYLEKIKSHFPNINNSEDWKRYLDSVYHRKLPAPAPQ